MEAAVTHGYLGARVKGYAEQRNRQGNSPAGKSLSDLANDMGALGFARSGPSPDGPVV